MQGTFTSQANVKLFNRLCEYMLHAVEAISVMFSVHRVDTSTPRHADVTAMLPGWDVLSRTLSPGSPKTIAEVAARPTHATLADALSSSALKSDYWEHVLLCQFHDVLPGSSIEMVSADCSAYCSVLIYLGVYNLLVHSIRSKEWRCRTRVTPARSPCRDHGACVPGLWQR